MRDALTRRVDPWQAALTGARLVGCLDADRLPRLSGLAEPEGPLQASLAFEPGHEGQGVERAPRVVRGVMRGVVRVAVQVTGNLLGTCQRCLEPVRIAADLDTVVMVADAARGEAGDDAAEWVLVEAGEPLDPAMLVEDELILALPFAPVHDEGECEAVNPSNGLPEQETAAPDPPPGSRKRTDNPFAVLGVLRARDRDDN